MNEQIREISSWYLIQFLGGITLIISALVSFVAILIKSLFDNRLYRKSQIEIEKIKGEFSGAHHILDRATTNLSNIYVASSPKTIEAYGEIWASMMNICRNQHVAAGTAYTKMSVEELRTIPTTSSELFKSMLYSINENDYLEQHMGWIEKAENFRPFVSTAIWNIFISYQALFIRTLFLLARGKYDKQIKVWHEDKDFLNQLINLSIDEKEMEKLLEDKVQAFRNVQSYLEIKFHSEVQEHLTGQQLASETIRQALTLSTIKYEK